MRLFRHLATSFSRANQLRGSTKILYTALSWLMVAAGCVLVGVVMFKTRAALGLPMGRAPLEGIRLRFLAWAGITLLSIPTLFYCGMVLVGSVFAGIMLISGRFSRDEAAAFALFAQPPERWLHVDRTS
jgi:hypothetical protein